eukprot:11847906-Ditylum_brightwellii.AAC.1
MNEAQQCYHKIHGVIDTIDHYLKNMRIAYAMYKDVCEGDLDANWKHEIFNIAEYCNEKGFIRCWCSNKSKHKPRKK